MKNCIFFVSIATVLLSVSVRATEPPEQVWVARYNGPGNSSDIAHAIAIDSSGNVYVTGTSTGSGTYYDYATIKYDSAGNELWVRRYTGLGENASDQPCAIAVDSSGNVYVTGYSVGSGTNTDYATIKYDTNGNELWVRRYNGPPGSYRDEPEAIAVDGSGNVYVTGWSDGGPGTSWDYATIKYDTSGNELWVRRYNGLENDWDGAYAIAVDSSGNVYVTGDSYTSGTGMNYTTIKYDSSGNELWVREYIGLGGGGQDSPSAIAVDDSGNVCVTGSSYDGSGNWDYATIKYDTNGNELWVLRYDGPTNQSDIATAIAIGNSGNVYVTGYSGGSGTSNDYATVKYDWDGTELWVCRYDGPGNYWDKSQAIALDGSGNIYVTGESYGGTNYDYATIRYEPDGTELWVRRYNGPSYSSYDYASAIAVDDSGNVYVTGQSTGLSSPVDYATIRYTQHDYCMSPFPADRNGDCKVNFTDFAIFAEDWPEGNSLVDLAELAEDWLECNFALQDDCF